MNVEPVDILLVEDNPGDVLLTRKAFERSRIVNTLHVVSDGEEALDYLHRRGAHVNASTPDLVLLDINLPKLSGHEVLAEVKEHEVLRRIPIIMLTSSEREADIARSYDHHANSYITKPPDLASLATAIQEVERYWFALVKRPVVGED